MMKIFDTEVNIEVRLFFILGWTALIANTVGFISNLIFYGLTPDTIFYGICAILMLLIGLFNEKIGNTYVAAGIILVIINFVEFPVMYYLYGSERIVYMILGVLGVLIFTSKERRVFWAVLTMCFDVVVIIFSVIHPSTYFEITSESDLGAAVVSFVIVMVSLILIIILLVKQYELQNQELITMTEELKMMANRDHLTELYNRRYLTEYLEKRMENADERFAVVLLDLDDFKAVNDQYGHGYGDEVLQSFSKSLTESVNDKGIVARFGGEEFMLVLDLTDEKDIDALMAEVKKKFEKFSMETKGIRLTFSGGVEIFHNEDRIIQLFNEADEKLYLAKAEGKNKIIYETIMKHEI